MRASNLGRISSTVAVSAVALLTIAGPASADPVESGGSDTSVVESSGGADAGDSSESSGGAADSGSSTSGGSDVDAGSSAGGSSGYSSDSGSSGLDPNESSGAGVGQTTDPVINTGGGEEVVEPEATPPAADPVSSGDDLSAEASSGGEAEEATPPAPPDPVAVSDTEPAEAVGEAEPEVVEPVVTPDKADDVPPPSVSELLVEAADAEEPSLEADAGEDVETLPVPTRTVGLEEFNPAALDANGKLRWDPIGYDPSNPNIGAFDDTSPLQVVSNASNEVTVHNPNPAGTPAILYAVKQQGGDKVYWTSVAPGETVKIKSDQLVAGESITYLAVSEAYVDENGFVYYKLLNEPSDLVISDAPPKEEHEPGGGGHDDDDDGHGGEGDGDGHGHGDGDHEDGEGGGHEDGGHHGGGGHDDGDGHGGGHHGGGHGGGKPDEGGDTNVEFVFNFEFNVIVNNLVDNSQTTVVVYGDSDREDYVEGSFECEGLTYDYVYTEEAGARVVSYTDSAGQKYQNAPRDRGVTFPAGINPTSTAQAGDGGPDVESLILLGGVAALGIAGVGYYGGRAVIRRRKVGGSSTL